MLNFKSLRGRLIFYFTLIIITALIISALTATGFIRLLIRRQAIDELNHQADIVAAETAAGTPLSKRFLRIMERTLRNKIIYLPAPRFNSRRLPLRSRAARTGGRLKAAVDWRLLNAGRRQVIEAEIPDTGTPAIIVVQPVNRGGVLRGAVVLARPLKFYRQAWLPITELILVAGLITLVISLIPALYLARFLSKPLKDISASAAALAGGDLNQRVAVNSRDELGELAASFNDMADKVGQSVKTRRNFIMNVSHELKTPLTSIQGYTEALLDKTVQEPAAAEKALKVIDRQSKHLARLITDLLDLAKLDAKQFSLRKTSVDLNNLLNDCRDLYQGRAKEKSLIFATDYHELPIAVTDDNRLRQIIINLLENAFKFTPAGGRISLTARHASGRLIINVVDSGPGLEAAEIHRIFQPFYRGQGSRGSGLGLAVASELAKALGGSLSVRSQPGKGSDFKLTLPMR